ncbi:hypothetical protein ACQUED_10290 [Lactococcus lactis]|uniref:hypothetical protein n=1 Tax=Lactococcus lactis TaxID=1358 RepID=UPI00131510F8|nr:hypothetical protein [Lactococcus lactis]WJQ33715.1 hypothetical protein LLUC08_02920 [Lactococcus lactis subsp. lactis]WKK96141.1 hypothetical protein LLUC11_02895 [Lactococcus lactis subsp. lactis]
MNQTACGSHALVSRIIGAHRQFLRTHHFRACQQNGVTPNTPTLNSTLSISKL